MKRLCIYSILTLGLFLISCNGSVEKKVEKNKEKTAAHTDNKKVIKKKITLKADDNSVTQFKDVTLESAILDFDREAVAAKSCEELIRACVNFDNKCKFLCNNNKNLTVPIIEKREDVYKIRKFAEEKSSALCNTSQLTQ